MILCNTYIYILCYCSDIFLLFCSTIVYCSAPPLDINNFFHLPIYITFTLTFHINIRFLIQTFLYQLYISFLRYTNQLIFIINPSSFMIFLIRLFIIHIILFYPNLSWKLLLFFRWLHKL
jgi:hypothetical protein